VTDQHIDVHGVTERAALVTYLMFDAPVTVLDVSRVTGLKQQGAWVMLAKMSRVLPIYRDEDNVPHVWHLVRK